MVAIGNTVGGKLTNLKPLSNLRKIIAGQVIIFVIIALVVNSQLLLLLTVIAMGLFAFMNVPGLQLAVLDRASTFTPNSIDLATALNISAFNLGIAGGSFIGGIIYATNNLASLGYVAAVLALIAIVLISITKTEAE